ncbi:SDR family oxidoreductase, partial [Mesorhizobium sp. J18]|uniref:SDR family NAD(P)-dependent oxidoreductase n=1 Tax=Mesorhizobium sp. J18 TaxID=935263 RepID=UPI0016476F64
WPVAIIDMEGGALDEAEERFSGEDALVLAADITDEDEIADAFDQVVDVFGLIGALVSCADRGGGIPFEDASVEHFREMLEVNLVGPFAAGKAAAERMGQTLAIVNVATVSALRASSGGTAYAPAKAGLKMLTEAMALELAPSAIRVNCVACGPVADGQAVGEALSRSWLARTPQRRAASAAEIASAVSFLLSRESDHITGHTLVVDGGFSAAGLLSD